MNVEKLWKLSDASLVVTWLRLTEPRSGPSGLAGLLFGGFGFAADDGQRLDGFAGDGVNGVEALGEQSLEVLGFGDFGFVGRGGKDVHGFDDFFVELEPFAVARGGLLEGMIDDARELVEIGSAALEVIAINGAQNFLGGDEGEGVGLGVRTHAFKLF